ncbi:hypothetical protein [Streptomyces sp. NPDC058374]
MAGQWDRWTKLELDTRDFDTERSSAYVEKARAEGIALTTLAELG